MPELPEVETVRASLAPRWIGRRVRAVRVARAGVVRTGRPGERPAGLGERAAVADILRHGKQLAIAFDSGRVVQVHLGMSGQLFVLAPGARAPRADHIHVRWRLEDGSTVCFRDPRRFGGLWLFDSLDHLRAARWNPETLGPDALGITARELRDNLRASSRAIKACLLDQAVLAGVGNIYADEALFAAQINPHTPAAALGQEETARLAASVRSVLRAAIKARGSTLRDYRDANLQAGTQQTRFRVYGRAGLPCPRCRTTLLRTQIAQRTTSHCPACQPC